MRRIYTICCFLLAFFAFILTFSPTSFAQQDGNKNLAQKILADQRLDTVKSRAHRLLSGFTAGTSYGEVWIRDFNTFINGSMAVHHKDTVGNKLLMFFRIQGKDGNIVDGVIDSAKAGGGYQYRYSDLLHGWAAHKNTVETDQESSLIQAVKKYIDLTGDSAILFKVVGGISVIERMELALAYVMHDRWSERYGLVTGATTIDWGDVQPEKGWGVAINDHTKWSIDIYDNAMYVKAIQDWLSMKPSSYRPKQDWKAIASKIKVNVKKYLWSSSQQKYLPHLYVDGSPFAGSFKENNLLYSGGSICAMIAGLNTPNEIRAIYQQLLSVTKKEKFATIGMTVYPPYPLSEFPNMAPYTYQNGGDWTWFGGRIIPVLIANKQTTDAYEVLVPMLNRVIEYNGFYEWYDVRTGKPKGSGDFRGEAGVLLDAINALQQWAKKES